MEVKVSKTMAKFINGLGLAATAEWVELPERAYQVMVGDVWDAIAMRDDLPNGNFKAIRVEYPDNYYACPVYLTTYNLRKEFTRRGVTDLEGFKIMLKDMIEI